jgi:diguanylate cyclase (GGDEF)-like protein
MYDPLVVDTFARVHTKVAPPDAPPSGAPSLMAITDASHSTSSTATASKHLDEITASTEEMLTLFDLARDLTPMMNFLDVGEVISKHLRRLVPCSLCVFFIYDVGSDDLVAAHCAGDNSPLLSGLRIGLGQRLSGWVAANRQTIRNSDAVLDLGDAARSITPRPRSCLSTPLLKGDSLVGVLTLYSTAPDAFSEEHQRQIEVVARQVAAIVKRTSELEVAGPPSLRDQLAGLPTVESMRQLMGTPAPQPTSVLVIHVNDLPAISRLHGNQAGDDVLCCVVAAARRNLRPVDLLLRSGTDRLVVLMLQTDKMTACSVSSKIQQAVTDSRSATKFSFEATVVTTTIPEDGTTLAEVIDRAAGGGSARVLERQLERRDLPPRSVH